MNRLSSGLGRDLDCLARIDVATRRPNIGVVELSLPEACEREVIDLHAFFVSWFRGEHDDAGELRRVEAALAREFELLSPRGARDDRESILEALRSARGRRTASFQIHIDAFEPRVVAPPLCLVTYREHHLDGTQKTTRISTALFREAAHAPCGVQWVHLHETWVSGE